MHGVARVVAAAAQEARPSLVVYEAFLAEDVADGLEEGWKRPMHWAGFLVVGAATRLPRHTPSQPAVVEGEAGAQKQEDGQTWGIKEWLVSISLQGYTDAMIEYGYDSLIALDAASEQEIKDMTEDEVVAMKKPHLALFMRKWKNRSWCGRAAPFSLTLATCVY